ncbi:S1C family serine protease [Nocardioides sp. LHG3406-4]|uniref:S1C family serine protease n=1 Tax=Nocardioides sp. LHG3406-4 TaxID=2804575 RepID=UPI003CF51E67
MNDNDSDRPDGERDEQHDDAQDQQESSPADTEPTRPLHHDRLTGRSDGWVTPSQPHVEPAREHRAGADQDDVDTGMVGPVPGFGPAGSPGPSPIPPQHTPYWGPPTSQYAGPQGAYGTSPMPTAHRTDPAPRGRVPGWLWPAVAALALVIGLGGGVLGAVVIDSLDDDNTVSGGLDSVDTRSEAPIDPATGSVAAVAQELLPSTVQILAEFEGEADGATGSGFVLDRQGHVITNNHVVASSAEDDGPIEVVDAEGNAYPATVVGRSAVYDLAVLLVKDASNLQPAALGASLNLKVGDPVVAFGSPLGLSQTVTAGIVSALNRPVTTGDSADDSSYINAVQTDAAINPGNSGGPLVNLGGQVVGVNSAIATTGGGFAGESGNIGVGFAIPIEQVRVTADQILETGEARYPVIGAQVQTGGRTTDGARIDQVMADTPAEDAGLRKDDLIVAVDGHRVTDGIALIVSIRTHQPGETVEFTVVRDGEERDVKVTLDSEVG